MKLSIIQHNKITQLFNTTISITYKIQIIIQLFLIKYEIHNRIKFQQSSINYYSHLRSN